MPPGVESKWEDMAPGMQAHLMAYDQGRRHEEAEESNTILKSMVGRSTARTLGK